MEEWCMTTLIPCGYLTQPSTHNHIVPKDVKKQNRVDIHDWTLEIKELSLLLILQTEEISLLGTILPRDIHRGECQPTPFTKATIVWEPKTHCQLFELIILDVFMVSYANEVAYLILSRELCLCSMSYLRGECALHNFQMNPLSESRKN